MSIIVFRIFRQKNQEYEETTNFFLWTRFEKDGRSYDVTIQSKDDLYHEEATFEIEEIYEGIKAYNNSLERIYVYTEEVLLTFGITSI